MCGKRLKALPPTLVPALERHGHLSLDPTVRERLLAVSAATIVGWRRHEQSRGVSADAVVHGRTAHGAPCRYAPSALDEIPGDCHAGPGAGRRSCELGHGEPLR